MGIKNIDDGKYYEWAQRVAYVIDDPLEIYTDMTVRRVPKRMKWAQLTVDFWPGTYS